MARRLTNTPWVLALLSQVGTAAALGVAVFLRTGNGPIVDDDSLAEVLGLVALTAIFGITGLLMVWYRPAHPVGWLFALAASGGAVMLGALEWAVRGLFVDPGSLPFPQWAAWIYGWVFVVPNFVPILALMLFPDGAPPAPPWRWMMWCACAAMLLVAAAGALSPSLLRDQGPPRELENPLGLPAATEGFLDGTASVAFIVLAAAAVGSAALVVLRLRRSDGRQRAQLRLFLVSALLLATGSVLPLPDGVFVAAIGLLPITACVAIVRYRLFDLERAVGRAITYVVLAVGAALAYLVLIGLAGLVAGGFDRRGDAFAAVAATAAAAVLFQPIRSRVDGAARRIAFGPQAVPHRLLGDLASELAAAPLIDEVPERLARSLRLALKASDVAVVAADGHELAVSCSALRESSGAARVSGAEDRQQWDEVVSIETQQEPVAMLYLNLGSGDRLDSGERELLHLVAAQSAPALKSVALTRELERRLEELESSRRRLLTAQQDERLRMERDLHDGAQYYLSALGAQLGLLAQLVSDDARLTPAIERAVSLCTTAARELRRLAHGMRPPLLEAEGVAAALKAFLADAGVPFSVRIDGDADWPEPVATTTWFVANEALQNAARHSEASAMSFSFSESCTSYVVVIRDDGCGFDPGTVVGRGIVSTRDRVEAAGGTFEIRSAMGGGTTLQACFPVR